MSHRLRYFNDVLPPGGVATTAEVAGHHLLYVASGTAEVHGHTVAAGSGTYCAGLAQVRGGAEGAVLLRWELADTAHAPARLGGVGVHSTLRMDREVWSFDLQPGRGLLLRLDRIITVPGRFIDLHTHAGPGIRALIEGSCRVRQTSEDGHATAFGDPWWESGVETVTATADPDVPSTLLRGLLLPVEFEGRGDTATFYRTRPSGKPNQTILVDQLIEI